MRTESLWRLTLETLFILVYHTPCSSRQTHKSGDAAWRSPAGQVIVPPPRCSSSRKCRGVCYDPKRTPIQSLVETWLWYKITETMRKSVVGLFPETFHLEGPLSPCIGTIGDKEEKTARVGLPQERSSWCKRFINWRGLLRCCKSYVGQTSQKGTSLSVTSGFVKALSHPNVSAHKIAGILTKIEP